MSGSLIFHSFGSDIKVNSSSRTAQTWYPVTYSQPYILVFPVLANQNLVLLGMRKHGLGTGKWCGFGGQITLGEGESFAAAAARELKKESRLEAKDQHMKYAGRNWYAFEGNGTMLDVRVWLVDKWDGNAFETEDMVPRWFSYKSVLHPSTKSTIITMAFSTDAGSSIDFNVMWEDYRIWFPMMLQGLHDGRLKRYMDQRQEMFVGRCEYQSSASEKDGVGKNDTDKLIRWEVWERL